MMHKETLSAEAAGKEKPAQLPQGAHFGEHTVTTELISSFLSGQALGALPRLSSSFNLIAKPLLDKRIAQFRNQDIAEFLKSTTLSEWLESGYFPLALCLPLCAGHTERLNQMIEQFRDAGIKKPILKGARLANFPAKTIALLSSAFQLPFADLSKANLRGADLGHANLYDAHLRGADLLGANLYGADLSGADLTGADLSHANLNLADLRRAYLGYANLNGADLIGVDLVHANLNGANLSETSLREAKLIGADLSGADLRGADLRGAVLVGACLPTNAAKLPLKWPDYSDKQKAVADYKKTIDDLLPVAAAAAHEAAAEVKDEEADQVTAEEALQETHEILMDLVDNKATNVLCLECGYWHFFGGMTTSYKAVMHYGIAACLDFLEKNVSEISPETREKIGKLCDLPVAVISSMFGKKNPSLARFNDIIQALEQSAAGPARASR